MIRRFRSWLRKEVNNMAVIYVALIVKGKRTYDSVPDLIKPQVKEMLIDLELAELVTEYFYPRHPRGWRRQKCTKMYSVFCAKGKKLSVKSKIF